MKWCKFEGNTVGTFTEGILLYNMNGTEVRFTHPGKYILQIYISDKGII